MRRSSLAFIAVVVALAECVNGGAAQPAAALGSGANEVWVLRPTGPVRSVVVFGHGWSTPFPWQGFAAWVSHLRARGSVVIYPRYRVGVSDSPGAALIAFKRGVETAFRTLGPVRVPVIALGKSFGGSAVFYYASAARSWGVPAPTAVVSIFPAYPLNGVLPILPLPSGDEVEIFVGDRDTVAGSAGADAFWRWLARHPSGRKRYILVRSRLGFVANHDSAQRSDRVARAVFWEPVDRIISAATAAAHGHGTGKR